jgi:tetratricopeptide (TPR) repeat protein
MSDQAKPDGAPSRSYRLHEVLAHYPGVREEHLRSLQKFGLIGRGVGGGTERRVGFGDLTVIRQLFKALQEGAPFKAVLRSMLASREGQLALDFRMDSQPATVVSLQASGQGRGRWTQLAHPGTAPQATDDLAEEYFHLASSLDDGTAANLAKAALAYRRALEIDPALVPALINLANIHYASDELIEALALCDRAVRLDPDVFEGHFNLGNIHHDLGRFAEAEACYRRALELNPDYPEAHLYLAVALEKAGRSDAARSHWRAYLNLAPAGEWVDMAKEFSE